MVSHKTIVEGPLLQSGHNELGLLTVPIPFKVQGHVITTFFVLKQLLQIM